MPYSKCPICGEISHFNVNDVQDWYRVNYPGLAAGELVPEACFYCWPQLDAGMRVLVRHAGAAKQDFGATSGVIERLVSASKHGTIYLVHLDSGKERYYIRAELRKAPDAGTQQAGIAAAR